MTSCTINQEDNSCSSSSSGVKTAREEESPPPTYTVDNITIRLTQVEEELFDTLIRAAVAYESGLIHLPDHLCTSIPHNSKHASHNHHLRNKIEIRIAGGWVRDKILQQESHDIDVTLNCMSGHAFATLVQAYLVVQASFATPNTDNNNTASPPSLTPKIAVISANPAQSKHLETATMKILGMDIDFTNLRAEELYQADSRIPTTQLGTPKEDAYRRDFTVNSLFYNIQTQQIEDWTGRGVQDLLYHKQSRPKGNYFQSIFGQLGCADGGGVVG